MAGYDGLRCPHCGSKVCVCSRKTEDKRVVLTTPAPPLNGRPCRRIIDAENYKARFEQAQMAWGHLKTLTKQHNATTWTPEYRELAEAIHTLGRDVFYVQTEDEESVLTVGGQTPETQRRSTQGPCPASVAAQCVAEPFGPGVAMSLRVDKTFPLAGLCYVMSEALYHVAGRAAGFKPHRLRYRGLVHWWLQHEDGRIIDLTAKQYVGGRFPYERGRAGGFLTRQPCRRTRAVMKLLAA